MELYYGLSRTLYLITSFIDYFFVPRAWHRHRLKRLLRSLSPEERRQADERVAYYCKLSHSTPVPATAPIQGGVLGGIVRVGEYRFPFDKKRRFTYYFFDLYKVVRHFDPSFRMFYIHGDVNEIPAAPALVKSRPILPNNANAVILKLDRHRHYAMMVKHDIPFAQKKDMLVGRSTWANHSAQRRALCEKFWDHPLCDVGKTRFEPNEDLPQAVKPFLTVREQLQYKFIASVEGEDVASNLKWVMSSNSVAVSPPLKFETWFMEGRLIGGYHYIEVKPDFSDLEEKLRYYMAHPEEAEAIIAHAHEHVKQFGNRRLERVIGLSVADAYFKRTQG